MRRRKKGAPTLEDYIVLSVPENPGLFGVQRVTQGEERFVRADPGGKELGPVYEGVTYLVSPYLNYDTGLPGESCTCLSWRTRHRRCIHLKKFFEMNPKMQPPDIYEDTVLMPIVLADSVSDELQAPHLPNLRELLSPQLENRANLLYRQDPIFRDKLGPCRNTNPTEGSPEEARDWLKEEMFTWASQAGYRRKQS